MFRLYIDSSYRGSDSNGTVLNVGDTVEILNSAELFAHRQGELWMDDMDQLPGKIGRIMYFDLFGLAVVTIAAEYHRLRPNTLMLVTSGNTAMSPPVLYNNQIASRCTRLNSIQLE